MKKFAVSAIIILSALMSGCAVKNDRTQFQGLGLTYQSNVMQLKSGDYYTEVEASPASGRIEGAIGTANKKASDFCRVQNKSIKVLKTDVDTHLLVNGVARLTFNCF